MDADNSLVWTCDLFEQYNKEKNTYNWFNPEG
jgi:hypothetical protein